MTRYDKVEHFITSYFTMLHVHFEAGKVRFGGFVGLWGA